MTLGSIESILVMGIAPFCGDRDAAARLLERGRILGFALVDGLVFAEAAHCYYVGYDEDDFR